MMPRLSEAQKIRARTLLENGWSMQTVADDLHVSKTCIFKLKQNIDQGVSYVHGGGARKISTLEDDASLVNWIQRNPFGTAVKAAYETHFPGSISTARQRIRDFGLKNYSASKKFALEPQHKQDRLNVNENADFWERVIFSDEKIVQSSHDGPVRVYRPAHSRYEERYIKPTHRSGRFSVQVWAWISCLVPGVYCTSIWLKDGQIVQTILKDNANNKRVSGHRFLVDNLGNLLIDNVRLEDDGRWQCEAENPFGFVVTGKPIQLTVLEESTCKLMKVISEQPIYVVFTLKLLDIFAALCRCLLLELTFKFVFYVKMALTTVIEIGEYSRRDMGDGLSYPLPDIRSIKKMDTTTLISKILVKIPGISANLWWKARLPENGSHPPRKPYLLIDNRILDPGNLFIPVKENTDLTVSCVVDGGNPRPTLSWELTLGSLALLDAPEVPYQALNLSETVREQKVGARNDARLERVMRAHHNATLTCIVHHIALLQPLNVSLLLDVQCDTTVAVGSWLSSLNEKRFVTVSINCCKILAPAICYGKYRQRLGNAGNGTSFNRF
ncbi:nephrin [Holotrichia oblita]|uniref:Nephrin n=1 Tax=Holotrichia oblita TaxID=644536 RepID=A0ACB9TTD8_HOLOL|nr:nephrin [Holotrichia oblita]